jgi:hypothetical protein
MLTLKELIIPFQIGNQEGSFQKLKYRGGKIRLINGTLDIKVYRW